MPTRLRVGIIASILVLIALAAWLIGPNTVRAPQDAQLANPASVNCAEVGGRLEIVTEAEGQIGYCHMPDGRVCEEWALLRDKACVSPR